MFRKLVWFAVLYTFVVVVVGAFVRLTDAGLGCPDWPGCYGELTPHHAKDDIAKAVEEQGGTHGPVSMGKAWKEMFHRYIAGGLGLVILAIAVLAWVRRAELRQSPLLACSVVAVVIFQALLGMWTVIWLVKPVIVMSHLMGGLTTFSLLAVLAWWTTPNAMRVHVDAPRLRMLMWIGLALLAVQIALGGWVASNYAALACGLDFPKCKGAWWPSTDFAEGFVLWRGIGVDYEGGVLDASARAAIQIAHRIGAAIVSAYFLFLGFPTNKI